MDMALVRMKEIDPCSRLLVIGKACMEEQEIMVTLDDDFRW